MIALDRSTKDNGCLQVLQGSHKAERISHGPVGVGQTGADPERVALLRDQGDLKVVHCEMEPGGVLFFHSNLLHRSDPNESDHSRWALICCYSAASNPTFHVDARNGHYERLERWEAEQVQTAAQQHWSEVGG